MSTPDPALLDDYTFDQPARRRRNDWTAYADGRPRRVVQGTHFHIRPENYVRNLRKWARENGCDVLVSHERPDEENAPHAVVFRLDRRAPEPGADAATEDGTAPADAATPGGEGGPPADGDDSPTGTGDADAGSDPEPVDPTDDDAQASALADGTTDGDAPADDDTHAEDDDDGDAAHEGAADDDEHQADGAPDGEPDGGAQHGDSGNTWGGAEPGAAHDQHGEHGHRGGRFFGGGR